MLIEIIILAAIAGFLFLRLREVLGRRTGHENPADYVRPRRPEIENREAERDVVVPFPGAPEPADPAVRHADIAALVDLDSDTGQALAKAKDAEPHFNAQHFVEGARSAYEMILMAYENGDKPTLRPLLAEDVYESFESAIDDRVEKGLTVDARFIGLRSAVLEDARLDEEAGTLQIDMRFDAEMIISTRNAEGEVVAGDPANVQRMNDLWTFQRRLGDPDPGWLLVETGA